jgi:hypothetical protein
MLRRFGLVGALVVLGLALGSVLKVPTMRAEEKKPEVLKTEGKDAPMARTIDFMSALEVDVATLDSLGGRIDQARHQADPVSLALAARELEAAEHASGKTTSLKGSDLEKEASEMACRRSRPLEIKMVKALVANGESQKKLDEALQRASEKSKGITGSVHVNNNSGQTVSIYINDRYVGYVQNNQEADYDVGNNACDNTKLVGRCGTKVWGPRYVPYETANHVWNLVP